MNTAPDHASPRNPFPLSHSACYGSKLNLPAVKFVLAKAEQLLTSCFNKRREVG